MAMGSEATTWVGKKPLRQIGGMSDALSIASDIGFSLSAPRSQEEIQNLTFNSGEKGDDLIRVLRELTAVQRKIADLQVEIQGRKGNKNMAHLTHVSEMEKKIETLARITTILKAVLQNKDCIIARLQQPYSLDCIPVEEEYQKQFSELLMKAASDFGALTASVADFQWSQNFKEPPSVWGEMLLRIPVALASCTRFLEAMSAMRESFATVQKLRMGQSFPSIPATMSGDPSQKILGVSDCVTPLSWRNESSMDDLAIRSRRGQGIEHLEDDNGQVGEHHPADGTGCADTSDLFSSMDDQIAKAKEQARSIKKILDKVERWKNAAVEEKWLDDYEKGGATSMPDREWRREILCRVEEAMDGFGGTSICSDSEGSISDDSAKQEQEDSESDGAGNEVEMLRICSLRWLCGLLLLLLILVLFMARICGTSISYPPLLCTYEGVSSIVSSESISSPIEGRRGSLSFTHEEAPGKIIEFFQRGRDATETNVDPSSGDLGYAKGLLREDYQYNELDETVEVQDSPVWKRVEVEPEESSKAPKTRVKKNGDVYEQENRGIESNFYWIKKNSEPRGSGIAEPGVGRETKNLLLEEAVEVGEGTSALIGIESATSAVLYSSAIAVLALVLVLYSRRKKNLDSSLRAPPKCPRQLAEAPGKEDHLTSDRVSSFPLESSPSLGSFTTIKMTSTRRVDGTGEARISIAAPVRRSYRIRDRATRSRRDLMSST